MINRDFDHLSTLLHLFFTRQDIQQKLNIIDQHNISGWEIWMQIEFANLLASYRPRMVARDQPGVRQTYESAARFTAH